MFKSIEKIKINKKQDILFLSIGFLLWVVGDLITTWYGFQIGLIEMNSFFSDSTIIEMIFFKLIIMVLVIGFIKILNDYDIQYLKIPLYTALISVGLLFAVINNSYLIYTTP